MATVVEIPETKGFVKFSSFLNGLKSVILSTKAEVKANKRHFKRLCISIPYDNFTSDFLKLLKSILNMLPK